MRYKVKNLEIRSENAAKSISQASRYLVDWLLANVSGSSVLDYGCGKLRYAPTLYKRSSNLVLVDSEIQLSRSQLLGKEVTNVRRYVKKNIPKASVFSMENFRQCKLKFEFVLCANVLSAMPSITERNKLFDNIKTSLSKKGVCLFTVQYKDQYFKEVQERPSTIPYLDGWIAQGPRGNAYYGILPKAKLMKILEKGGFKIKDAWNHGSSAYVLATLPG